METPIHIRRRITTNNKYGEGQNKKMKVLITGGCGFLGSNLALETFKRNDELFIVDNLYRENSEHNLEWLKSKGNFKFYNSDVRTSEEIDNVIKDIKPDVLFHLAGQVAMTTSIANPKIDFEINALGTFNVLNAVKMFSPESIVVYSSTNKVYGDIEWVTYKETDTRYVCDEFPFGFPETIPLEFHSPYGCSKGSADQYMLDFHRIFGIKTIVFRHSSMFGGRQYSTYDQGWIGWFCQKALETKKGLAKEPFNISGNGKQVRDVLYADDTVDLYFKAIEKIELTKGKAFNIGGGIENSLSLLELFLILEQELEVTLKYVKLPPRASDQKIFVADITKIKNLLNWQPTVDKINGIKKMIEWVEGL
ncbi:MAG: SDR family NAD(P)-dependent oxidoreductase [Smithella sp.]